MVILSWLRGIRPLIPSQSLISPQNFSVRPDIYLFSKRNFKMCMDHSEADEQKVKT